MAGNIREFENPVNGLQPNDLGVTAYRQLAVHQESAGNQIGGVIGQGIQEGGQVAQQYYDQAVTQPAALKSSRDAAELMNSSTQGYNEFLKANPDDPDAPKKYRETVLQPALDKYLDGAVNEQDRVVRQQRAERMYDSFVTTGMADVQTRAGASAATNLNDTLGLYGSVVSQNPAKLDFALGEVDAAVKAGRDLIKDPQQLAKYDLSINAEKAKIVNTAIASQMTQDHGAGAQQLFDDLSAGKYSKYASLNPNWGNEVETLKKSALGMANEYKTYIQGKATQEYEGNVREGNTAISKIWTGGMKYDPDGTLHADPAIPTNLMAAAAAAGTKGVPVGPFITAKNAYDSEVTQSQNGVPVQTKGAVYDDLRKRLYKGGSDGLTAEMVDAAEADRLLSPKDSTFLRTAVSNGQSTHVDQSHQFDKFLAANKGVVIKGGLGFDPQTGKALPTSSLVNQPNFAALSEQKYLQFSVEMEQRYWAGIGQGKTPQQLINPGSKDYILNPSEVKQLQYTGDYRVASAPGVPGSAANAAPRTQSLVGPDGKAGMDINGWAAAIGGDPKNIAGYTSYLTTLKPSTGAATVATPSKAEAAAPLGPEKWLAANPGKTMTDYGTYRNSLVSGQGTINIFGTVPDLAGKAAEVGRAAVGAVDKGLQNLQGAPLTSKPGQPPTAKPAPLPPTPKGFYRDAGGALHFGAK